MKKCKNCGELNGNNAEKCYKCDILLPNSTEHIESNRVRKPWLATAGVQDWQFRVNLLIAIAFIPFLIAAFIVKFDFKFIYESYFFKIFLIFSLLDFIIFMVVAIVISEKYLRCPSCNMRLGGRGRYNIKFSPNCGRNLNFL